MTIGVNWKAVWKPVWKTVWEQAASSLFNYVVFARHKGRR